MGWIYEDLNGDGQVDTLRVRWNGKDAVVVDEGARFLWRWQRDGVDASAALMSAFSVGAEPPVVWNPARAGWGSYLILVDVDGDGQFGGTGDFYYRVVDVNGDGLPEIEYFSADGIVEMVVNVNGERDFKYLDFARFGYVFVEHEQRYSGGSRYYQNVHGSGFFHNTRVAWDDLSLAWEAPIAWYDFNQDGLSDMVMRIADLGHEARPFGVSGSGGAHEAEFAFELNGELNREKWHSLDFQLTYTAYDRPGLPLMDYVDDVKAVAAPEYAGRFFGKGWEQLRSNSRRIYLPFVDGYKIATDFRGWTGAWLLWDEDNDDNRWEEMFSRHETQPEAPWREASDKIGDRVEIDSTFRGGGRLYIGAFDGRVHLYGADKADWNIDYYAHYKGASDRVDTDEGPEPPVGLLHDVVRYYDTDQNGFADRIEYGTAEYGREEGTWQVSRQINILDFADADHPHPDVQPLFDLRVDVPLTGWKLSTWDGNPFGNWIGTAPYEGYRKMKTVYEDLCARQWRDARMLYDTAVYLGLNKREMLDECAAPAYLTKEQKALVTDIRVLRGYTSLTDACGLREKYHYGYWLKEKVLADILNAVDPAMAAKIHRLYYTGRIVELCTVLMQS